MKKIKISMLLFSLLFIIAIHLQANEKILQNNSQSDVTHNKQLTKVFQLPKSITGTAAQIKSDASNFARAPRQAGSLGNAMVWILGIVMIVGGAVVSSGGIAMTYFSAEGLHFFDDPKVTVTFWNNNDQGLGIVCLAFGITFIAVGTLLFASGIIMVIAGLVGFGSGYRAKLFITPRGDTGETAVGLSYKL